MGCDYHIQYSLHGWDSLNNPAATTFEAFFYRQHITNDINLRNHDFSYHSGFFGWSRNDQIWIVFRILLLAIDDPNIISELSSIFSCLVFIYRSRSYHFSKYWLSLLFNQWPASGFLPHSMIDHITNNL